MAGCIKTWILYVHLSAFHRIRKVCEWVVLNDRLLKHRASVLCGTIAGSNLGRNNAYVDMTEKLGTDPWKNWSKSGLRTNFGWLPLHYTPSTDWTRHCACDQWDSNMSWRKNEETGPDQSFSGLGAIYGYGLQPTKNTCPNSSLKTWQA